VNGAGPYDEEKTRIWDEERIADGLARGKDEACLFLGAGDILHKDRRRGEWGIIKDVNVGDSCHKV